MTGSIIIIIITNTPVSHRGMQRLPLSALFYFCNEFVLSWIKQIFFLLQFIGIITYLLGVCNELVAPTNAKKSKKKINHSPDELKTHKLLNKLNEAVQNSICFLEQIFDNWPQYEKFDSTLEAEFCKLNLNNKYNSPVAQKLKNGQQDMVNDVKNILKRKSKYLQSLVQWSVLPAGCAKCFETYLVYTGLGAELTFMDRGEWF